MSKTSPRTEPEYWEGRLFRNTFTYRGSVREVSGWSMKVQHDGRRRTIRLSARDREVAAREAARLYRAMLDGGWSGVERERRRLTGGGSAGKREPGFGDLTRIGDAMSGGEGVVRVTPRKYVGALNAGFERELFAEVTWDGVTEYLALGTEEPNEAALKARDLLAQIHREGWSMACLSHSREVTIAVFWQANPLACTYTTLLTRPAAGGASKPAPPKSRGWRVLLVEPDGGVRRALAGWLAQGPGDPQVVGVPLATEAVDPFGWDLILAHREQASTMQRLLELEKGEGGSPRPRLLTHGVFADSDAIFASFSGVGRGYVLRRVPPTQLLAPLLAGSPDGPVRGGGGQAEEDRHIRRHFQAMFEDSEPVSVPSMAELTPREQDILTLLARGHGDKEIGRELGISAWTVHTHLKRIFAKYGVRTRTEAVVRHLQKGGLG